MNNSLPRLQVRNIRKSYPGCIANNRINMTIQPGEIHALLGENGAGKSTLMKIIYGLIPQDSGEILWEGNQINFATPEEARMLGIGMVFQDFSLFECLTVTENIALTLRGKWNLKQVDRKIRFLSKEYGLKVNPSRLVHTLAVGEKQKVEILRCLCQNTKLLILDEPTAVLTPQEIDKLFATLKKLAINGCSILFSSHKLNEIHQLCTNATVLRQGKVVENCNPQKQTPNSLAELMISEDRKDRALRIVEEDNAKYSKYSYVPGDICLQVRDLCLPKQHPYGIALRNINFEVGSGEIIGIAGVAGNGQSELTSALSGEIISSHQMIMLGEMPIGNFGVTMRRRLGIAYAPEERLSKAIVANMTLQENALLTAYGQGMLQSGMIRQSKLKAWTKRIVNAFDIRGGGLNSRAGSLSGGNLQKFILGREIQQNPIVLIAAHPTWGVDINACTTIHNALIQMRDSGSSVIVISEDLDELFSLCNRIAVIYKGRLSPLKAATDINRKKIGQLMGGIGF
ncbi:MAG: ABC transporter ATP-binding protein [Rivularia sp. (in: Bacteria)]|nr:ABC transporter ATP-binding protein [Rivularia sp. MS3]